MIFLWIYLGGIVLFGFICNFHINSRRIRLTWPIGVPLVLISLVWAFWSSKGNFYLTGRNGKRRRI